MAYKARPCYDNRLDLCVYINYCDHVRDRDRSEGKRDWRDGVFGYRIWGSRIHLYVRGICGCTHDLAWNPEIVEKISLRT